MNQEYNNFNTYGDNGVPNNQPLNNQSFNQGMSVNQQPINPQPQPTQTPINNTFERTNANNQNFNSKPPKKNNLWILVITVIIGVVVIIGGIMLLNNNIGQSNQENNTDNNDVNVNDTNSITDKITLEMVNNHPTSPESDFEITDYGNGVVVVSKYLGDDEIVVIPETINGKKVTELGAYVFANDYHPNTKAVKLSNGITTISTGAFGLNEVIEIFVAGNGLEEIETAAFQNCLNLTTVILNDGLKTLGSLCFSSCDNLIEIEIPSSVKEINHMAFYHYAENFTIIGTSGTVAEQFAINNNIKFETK